jgi:protein SCO1/2
MAGLLVAICPAFAAVTQEQLASAAFEPPPNAQIPPSIVFRDTSGRRLSFSDALAGLPGLVIPADFTCHTLCGPGLTIASGAVAESGLRAGQDFQLIVVGLDPHDDAADARAFAAARIAEPIAAAAIVLQGDSPSTAEFLAAAGYRAVYDAQTDQFAHPAGAFVATPDGRVSRVLSTLALNPRDVRLSLVEAAQGRIGNIGDRLTLLCSQFDPARGIYTAAITRILQACAAVTVLLLAAVLFRLHARHRRERVA